MKVCDAAFASEVMTDLGKAMMAEKARADRLEEIIPYLKRALKFYAEATDADWNNDHGFNASAALSNLTGVK